MRNDSPASIRDRASRRVRRLTACAIGGATALTAAFAGIAAGSTHTKSTSAGTKATKTAEQKTVTAPVPSITSNGSAATPATQAQTQPAQQQTQVQPSYQPPVAVTGGS